LTHPIKDHQKWLKDALPKHARLTDAVILLLEGMIKKKGIEYLSVTGRTKDTKSAIEKIKRKKYRQPEIQIIDLSGIRVVTFLEDQVQQIVGVIRELFEVDEVNSKDRSESLGHDRLGYRSTHFVCVLGKGRDALPEHESLGHLKFEIQVRTVLQHAWAELAHDRSFKFKTGLPVKLERKLNLYSGMLEIVDSGFDEIAKEIDRYNATVSSASTKELSKIEIDSISINRFFSDIEEKYGIEIIRFGQGVLADVINELRLFGISNIGELEKLAPTNLIEIEKKSVYVTDAGLLRHLMMYNDIDKYFWIWKKEWWSAMEKDTFEMLSAKFGVKKVKSIIESRDISIEIEPS
jgi:putative GTP pyrophosphokinase